MKVWYYVSCDNHTVLNVHSKLADSLKLRACIISDVFLGKYVQRNQPWKKGFSKYMFLFNCD